MKIVFLGNNTEPFLPGFSELIDFPHETRLVPVPLADGPDTRAYAEANVLISTRFDSTLPVPQRLQLLHVPGAGLDAVALDTLPPDVAVCNCFGHENAIAEYVFAALLSRAVPLADADARLRRGEWAYRAGSGDRLHGELGGKTIGLLGFGHIGRAVAARAKAFSMRVNVANRSPIATTPLVDRVWTLGDLAEFYASADFILCSLPLTAETKGMVDASAFSAMRPDAVVINVGRAETMDEQALFDALEKERIAGAVIDTWYRYPAGAGAAGTPANLPFDRLANIVMTPHMSAWTGGTIRRRQQAMVENITALYRGEPLRDVVHRS